MELIIKLLAGVIILFLFVGATDDYLLVVVSLSVFFLLLKLCLREVNKDKRSPSICKCKRGLNMELIIKLLSGVIILFLIIAATGDLLLVTVSSLVFFLLLYLCLREVNKDKRFPSVCKCKRGELVKYDEGENGIEVSCITKKGVRKQVKEVYKCKNCGRITIVID
ncbi:hypothetical protein [Oceanirhabdus sp. W0125-5]|uniref:hypothetical protein n=1 Tax=Oceanirhabdus sp. W0125-5 TaxID=2999116 RepID=UPI0022F2EA49|nr:hypothetical protein [Oceanirhabdus sp. W0125-5]WBW96683.1 hypothetical protein OW730_23765 [Oceanirhabdus sp. W0125-5]